MGKAISEIVYNAWIKRMEPFLLCYDRDRLMHLHALKMEEKKFVKGQDLHFGMGDDAPEATVSFNRKTTSKSSMSRKKGNFTPLSHHTLC